MSERHTVVVELNRQQVDEMLRAYLGAKFQIPVTPFHEVQLKVLHGAFGRSKFVVSVVDPPPAPGAAR